MKKRLICASLAVALLIGCLFTGCSKPSTENQQLADRQKSDAELLGTVVEGTYLIEDGSTDYVLVLPASALAKETFAAEEFNTMMEMAAGCTLQIVTGEAVLLLRRKQRQQHLYCRRHLLSGRGFPIWRV